MGRAGKERLLMTSAKVHFILELNLNSEEKGGRGRDRMAVVINELNWGYGGSDLFMILLCLEFLQALGAMYNERKRKG